MYQMSSDEDEPGSPVLPKDSDRGSTVSSELQEEYEELLRYAIVTPKVELLARAHSQQLHVSHLSAESQTSPRSDDTKSQRPAAKVRAKDARSSRVSPVVVEPTTHSGGVFRADKMAGCSFNRMPLPPDSTSDRFRRGNGSPDSVESRVVELFISEANMNKMENILDSWSNNLKINVLEELQRWKIEFEEQHERELRKEREAFAIQTASLMSELDSLKELVRTYEASNRRKDEMSKNLFQALEKQKEKLEKMKAFTQWKFTLVEAKYEAHALRGAEHYYNQNLKKKVWYSWQGLIQKQWKEKVEKACQTRAEEVCTELATNYETRLAEKSEALETAQAEIQRLRSERERYEQAAKKAVMRGLCAFNLEALSALNTTDGWPEQMPSHSQHDPPPPPGAPPVQHEAYPGSSAHYGSAHYDHPDPSPHHDADNMMSGVPMSRAELPQPTTIVHNPLPQEGAAGAYQQAPSGRVITAVQQKPLKTVYARVTARPVASTAARSSLHMTGVAPPMTSVSVERHHPVLQNTIGHHMAARFPRSVQQGSRGGRAARTQAGTCHVHSIKVVQ